MFGLELLAPYSVLSSRQATIEETPYHEHHHVDLSSMIPYGGFGTRIVQQLRGPTRVSGALLRAHCCCRSALALHFVRYRVGVPICTLVEVLVSLQQVQVA